MLTLPHPRLRRGALALAVAVALPACGLFGDTSAPLRPLGVTLQGEDVAILVPACRDRGPDAVEVFEVPPDTPDDADGELVWSLDASAATAPRTETFTVGDVPEGYDETTPLADDLAPDRLYTARVTGGDSLQQSFVIAEDLEVDTVLQNGQPVTPEAFAESTACPEDE